jgi:hypothetical protein
MLVVEVAALNLGLLLHQAVVGVVEMVEPLALVVMELQTSVVEVVALEF